MLPIGLSLPDYLKISLLDKVQDAVNLFKRALTHAPNHPDLLANYGDALVTAGNVSDGIKVLQHAHEVAPTRNDIHNKLQQAVSKLSNSNGAV